MEFSIQSLWELTKLFVRTPATAARLVKVAELPIQVSVLMIVLAGVASGMATGLVEALVPAPPVTFTFADGTVVEFEQSGPFVQAAFGVVAGLALAYVVFRVGARLGGTGTLADILGIMAVLQMIMIVISIIQTGAILIAPVLGFAVLIFGLYVFFRGLGHAVNIGHEFDDMGKSAMAIVVSLVALAAFVVVVAAVLGIGPSGEVQ